MSSVRGRHFATGEPIEITLENGLITAIQPTTGNELPYVAPAFFDLQINGAGGHNFTSDRLTLEDIPAVVALCRAHGIGALCPTIITSSFATQHHAFSTLAAAVEGDESMARALPCFHLEGPYIAAEDGPRGAHPREHVRPPDWDEFARLQDAAGGRIRLVTLAPEHDAALAFIERLVHHGVVVALGHTAARPERIRDAVRAGARLSTHLGNGCATLMHRHDNVLWEQLANDGLWASIICDGQHLPPALVQCIVRMKSPARVILTCDASSLAGLPPGRYREWGQELEITEQGRIGVVGQPVLAGSWAFTDACVGNVMSMAGVSLGDAVAMATDRPRELLGLPRQGLEVGMAGDVIAFDLGSDATVLRIQKSSFCRKP